MAGFTGHDGPRASRRARTCSSTGSAVFGSADPAAAYAAHRDAAAGDLTAGLTAADGVGSNVVLAGSGASRLRVAVGLLRAGCGGTSRPSSSSSKVSAADYVKSVCSVIGPFERSVQARSNQLNSPRSRAPPRARPPSRTSSATSPPTRARLSPSSRPPGCPTSTTASRSRRGIVSAFTQVKGAHEAAASQAGSLRPRVQGVQDRRRRAGLGGADAR